MGFSWHNTFNLVSFGPLDHLWLSMFPFAPVLETPRGQRLWLPVSHGQSHERCFIDSGYLPWPNHHCPEAISTWWVNSVTCGSVPALSESGPSPTTTMIPSSYFTFGSFLIVKVQTFNTKSGQRALIKFSIQNQIRQRKSWIENKSAFCSLPAHPSTKPAATWC